MAKLRGCASVAYRPSFIYLFYFFGKKNSGELVGHSDGDSSICHSLNATDSCCHQKGCIRTDMDVSPSKLAPAALASVGFSTCLLAEATSDISDVRVK